MKQTVITFLFILSLFGCEASDPILDHFETYQQRIADTMNSRLVPLKPIHYIALPNKRDTQLTLQEIRIGLFEAYQFNDCGLFQKIAERNSILGKIQDDFYRLSYEMALIQQLDHCIAETDNEALKNELEIISNIKKNNLAALFSNLVTGSEAWRAQLTPSYDLIPSPGKHPELITAIEQFSNTLEQNEHLISNQQIIEKYRRLGSLFYSIDESTRWIETINLQLKKDSNTLICGENIHSAQFSTLKNIFNHLYIQKIQPYLSQLNAEYLTLSPALARIYSQLPENDEFKPYGQAYFEGEHFHQFTQAMREHVNIWKELFQRCEV